MIISRTPLRISFFGGGTDYPEWYCENRGAVLATTINKYYYISCRPLPPFFDFKHRIIYSKIETVNKIDEIQHPSVRECFRFMNIKKGLEIHYDGDLPARTGLGSSSCFTVGMLHALYGLKGKMITKRELAFNAIALEQGPMKEKVGSQDQIMASFGGFNIVEFYRNDIRVRDMLLDADKLLRLQDHMMLFFTGISRMSSQITEGQIKNIPKRKAELRDMYQLVWESIKVLNSNKDISGFGKLLDKSWRIKKTLAQGISSDYLDDIYKIAKQNGAAGGKLLGAGGGGFFLIFAERECQQRIKEKLKKLLHVPFRFENIGSQIIFYSHPESQV